MRYILLFCIFFSITFVSLYTWDFFSHRPSQAVFLTTKRVILTPTVSILSPAFPTFFMTPTLTPTILDPTPTFFPFPLSPAPTPTIIVQEKSILKVKNALNNTYVLQDKLSLINSTFTFFIKTEKSLPRYMEQLPFFALYDSKGTLVLAIAVEDVFLVDRINMYYMGFPFDWATDIPDSKDFYWQSGERHTLEITLRQGETPTLLLDNKQYDFMSGKDSRMPSSIDVEHGNRVLVGNKDIMVEDFTWIGK